nr:helix-turn-helix transcriptional regulator [Streptomyces sp. S1D4-11]QIY93248.1 transcriptional regulator [Streptomyces sp. S1D4-11]
MSDRATDAILAALMPVIEGLAATLGPACEVVLHDYRRGDRSVVAVAGQVTGRQVGGALSEIGLSMLAKGDDAANDLNYVTHTPGGRVVKSSTMPLRDEKGHLFGALCVNLDVTALRQAGDLLSALAGAAPAQIPTTTFANDFDEVVDVMVRAEELARGKPIDSLTRGERLDLLRAFDERAVFAVRNAVPRVAARLGVSRSAIYADLAKCRGAVIEGPEREQS